MQPNTNPAIPNPNQQPQPAPNPNQAPQPALPERQVAPPAPEVAPPPPPAAPAPQPVPLPSSTPAPPTPIPAAPTPPAATPAPQVPPNPATAGDVDVIEKEWVDQADKIIAQTKHDPYVEEEAVESLQQDYLKKRYGHDVKKSDGP